MMKRDNLKIRSLYDSIILQSCCVYTITHRDNGQKKASQEVIVFQNFCQCVHIVFSLL